MKFKRCESCGMIMYQLSDFGGESLENDYCKYCCDEDGNLREYSSNLYDTTNYIRNNYGVNFKEASEMAKNHFSYMPVWKRHLR